MMSWGLMPDQPSAELDGTPAGLHPCLTHNHRLSALCRQTVTVSQAWKWRLRVKVALDKARRLVGCFVLGTMLIGEAVLQPRQSALPPIQSISCGKTSLSHDAMQLTAKLLLLLLLLLPHNRQARRRS